MDTVDAADLVDVHAFDEVESQQAKLAREYAWPDEAGVPRWLRRAVDAGLAPDPEQRPPTMVAMLRLLEPPRRRWPALGITGAIGLIVGTLVVGPWSSRDAQPAASDCESASALDGEWTEQRRDQLRKAAPKEEAILAQHVDAWRAAWAAACATEPAGDEEMRQLELRRSCLRAQGRQLAVTLELLESQQVQPERAVRLLPSASACEGRGLSVLVLVPEDPTERAAVEALRVRLSEVQTQQIAGLLAEADDAAQSILADARALGFAPLVADALYVAGTVASMRGEPKRGVDLLVEAAQTAIAGGHKIGAAEAWLYLMVLTATDIGEVDRAREHAALARGAIDALGSAPIVGQMEVRYHLHLGELHMTANDYVAALASLERAEAFAIEHDPERLLAVREGMALVYQSTDRVDEALRLHEQNLSDRLERLGTHHPSVMLSHLNLGGALVVAGRSEDALTHARAAVEISDRLGGPGITNAVLARLGEIEALRTLGRTEDALAVVRQAGALLQSSDTNVPRLSAHQAMLEAELLFELGSDREGIAVARRGLATADHALPSSEIAAFLRIILASALARDGRVEEALAIAEGAVAVQRSRPGADAMFVTMSEQTLAEVLLEAGRATEAVALLEAAVEAYAKMSAHPGKNESVHASLVRALWESGQRARSRTLAPGAYRRLLAAEEPREAARLQAWARQRRIRLD